jgi:sugar phosphate isomerase/epimerase
MKIGLRIPGACGKELPLAEFAAWCKSTGFDSMDLGKADPERVAAVKGAGLELGTIDLQGMNQLLHPDEEERKKGIETGIAALNAIAEAGATKAFCVFVPGHNSQQSRRDSFENWKSSFPVVAAEAEKVGVRIAMEGWPGPNNAALGVTPEQWRAMFEAVPSDAFGLNYDPSHLVRIGVDYKRALNEFASKVIHAHGKDTALDAEGSYLYGNIGPAFDKLIGWSGGDWRYCIPGEGYVDWGFVCGLLHAAGFTDGTFAIELEDFRYNNTVEGEKKGLTRARQHLQLYL